jgi:phage terminase small subunit
MPPMPTPTALKKLRGNPGKRALNRTEPTPAPACPDPPAFLTDADAIAIWHEEAPTMIALGLLGTTHRRAFAMLCDKLAAYYRGRQNDRETLSAILRLMDGFGMTPAAQSKVRAPSTEPTSKWAMLLRRKPA